jgi:hypothetical protein
MNLDGDIIDSQKNRAATEKTLDHAYTIWKSRENWMK